MYNKLYERITAHFGLGHNVVPPIPSGLKERLPTADYTAIEKLRQKVGEFKTLVEREFKKAEAEAENGNLVQLYNGALVKEKELRAKQNVGKSQQPSGSQLPSSSHGFKPEQQAARAQAQSANAGKVAPAENKSVKGN
jgi:hypothetical protein